MKKNKTAIILTIVNIILWAVFLIIRLSILPNKEAHLSYQIDCWLLLLSSVLTSVSAAFWLAALARKWNIASKIIVWCLYGVTSLFWMLVVAAFGSYFGSLVVDRYACDNDKNYVMYSYFDAPFSVVSLYQKQGLVETGVCFLDFYYPFDDPKLFVYENADAIVVQHSKNDSVYTDVYHFNGDIYEGSAKDSILDAIKVAKCL